MPTNPFRAALDKLQSENPFRAKLEQEPESPPANYVAREMAARGLVNNVLAAPSASGDLLAAGSAVAQHFNPASALWRVVDRLRGKPESERPTFRERFAEEKEKFPANILRRFPRPTTTDITAAVQSIPSLIPGGETPGQAFERNVEKLDEEEFAMRAAHPVAAGAGDVAGDVASLFLARRGTGVDNLIRRAEAKMGARESAQVATTLAEDLSKVITSPKFRTLARGANRSVEAGIEAAALDIINDKNADPVEIAAVAAGGQMVGSGALAAAQGLLSGGPMRAGAKMTVLAASTLGLLQVLKSATPGGEDRILESIESAYNKVTFALAAGVGAAALGATRYGRGNTALADQSRTFLDGIATAHRGTTLSLLTTWNEADPDERATIEKVLTAVAADPYYRGQNAAERKVISRMRNRQRTGGRF